jgi:hypothetical protein
MHPSGFQNTGALQQLYLITKQLLFRRAAKLNKSACTSGWQLIGGFRRRASRD